MLKPYRVLMHKTEDGEWYFTLNAFQNGQVVMTSGTYSTESNCHQAATTVAANFVNEVVVEHAT